MSHLNKYGNIKRILLGGEESWRKLEEHKLSNIRVNYTDSNKVIDKDDHAFINMCSCSYLGLDRHPAILEGSINAIQREKTLLLPTSRVRIGLRLIDEAESILSELFECKARISLSCAAASSGMLPLIASGMLTCQEKPIMVFDKFAHFSMNHIKSSCGDETEVLTCNNNDVSFLEDICKKFPNKKIVYVADGAYSMGGYAPVEDLEALQHKYGLYLYFDDSHSISVYGKKGVGYVKSKLKHFAERTFIVTSLGKGFGVMGGLVLTSKDNTYEKFINVFGPQGWSQTLSVPGLGGVIASSKIHLSSELNSLQKKLQDNMKYFDQLCPTVNKDNGLPIRIVELHKPDKAIEISSGIFRLGYYTSAVFFPIVAKDRAGLRIMIRADLEKEDILHFNTTLSKVLKQYEQQIIS
jgi:7-keto-8-aminopelargonate synthetase-like enzyme